MRQRIACRGSTVSDRQSYSEEIKAAAMADLMSGEQPAVVAQRYGLNRETVKTWKKRLEPITEPAHEPITEPDTTIIRRPTYQLQQERIGSLIIQVLEARLQAQVAIAHHVRTNGTWINNQSASELAALDGHFHRTAVDVLDRLAGRHNAQSDEGGENPTGD